MATFNPEILTPENMLYELLSNELIVILIPADEVKHTGHCIRVCESQNALWYQDFCGKYKSNRRGTKWRTRIRRRETIKALKKLIATCNREIVFNSIKDEIYIERLIEYIVNHTEKQSDEIESFDLFFMTSKYGK